MNNLSIPIIGLTVAVFVLVLLVLRTKVHALIAMLIAACIAGLTGGLSMDETLDAITKGFGSTLGTIGIVIGLGVMMGRVLEVSGAAERIAYSFIQWLGKRREEWALALTGYIVSIPIFVDSAFVILYPVAKALAKKGNRSLLTLSVALAGGLVVTHTTVPPTPGPLGAAALFGIDIGAMMLLGALLAIPCVIGIVWYAQWLEKKHTHFTGSVSDGDPVTFIQETSVSGQTHEHLPGIMRSLIPIVVPIILIFLKALLNFFPQLTGHTAPLIQIFVGLIDFAGAPIIALSISTIIAVYTLVPHLDRKATSLRLEEGLQSAGIILLVTGAGGALGAVVRDSGAGTELAKQVAGLPISPVMIPFVIATLVRLIQGSGTVACITSASIAAPILAEVPDINLLFAAQAAVMGSFFFSYFNDSLFWVVNRMMGIVDVKLQIEVWSMSTTIAWGIGGTSIALVNLVFGAGGTWLDPVFPVLTVVVIFFVIHRRFPLRTGMVSTEQKK
jgi:gluconate transporter